MRVPIWHAMRKSLRLIGSGWGVRISSIFFFQRVVAYSFFLHFGFSLFIKLNPKNHLLISFAACIFLIRVRKPAPLSGFWDRGYLASYLAFLPKSRHFCPKTGGFSSFRTYIVFRLFGRIFLYTSPKISGQTSLYQPWLSPYCLFKD